jgi:hypothetical protein
MQVKELKTGNDGLSGQALEQVSQPAQPSRAGGQTAHATARTQP